MELVDTAAYRKSPQCQWCFVLFPHKTENYFSIYFILGSSLCSILNFLISVNKGMLILLVLLHLCPAVIHNCISLSESWSMSFLFVKIISNLTVKWKNHFADMLLHFCSSLILFLFIGAIYIKCCLMKDYRQVCDVKEWMDH